MILPLMAAVLAATPSSAPAPETPPAPPSAQHRDIGYLTASQLALRCTDADPISISYCYGFLAAVHDSVRAYEAWLHVREFCAPERTSQSELRRAFLGHFDSHPADKNGQAASVVLAAFKQRFACPQKGAATVR